MIGQPEYLLQDHHATACAAGRFGDIGVEGMTIAGHQRLVLTHARSRIAVTPMPPAVQAEAMPRLAWASRASVLASPARMRPPVAAKGWPIATLPPLTLSLEFVDGAQRGRQSQAVAAVVGRFPGLEQAQRHGGEGLVNLVVVKLLQRQPRVLEDRGHRIGRGHQQAFLASRKVHCPGLAGAQIGLDRKLALARPLLRGQQQRRGPVRQRCAVFPAVNVPGPLRSKTGRSLPSLSSVVSERTLLSVLRSRKGTTRSS